MKYLITEKPFTSFWEFPTLRRANTPVNNFRCLQVPTRIKSSFNFPTEITQKIILLLFETFLQHQNFALAFQLCKISKFYTRQIYYSVFGYLPLHSSTLLFRMGRILELVEAIDDDYLTQLNYDSNERVVLSLMRPTLYQPTTEPWDLLSSFELDAFAEPVGYHTFISGPMFADIVWSKGNYNNYGVFDTPGLRRPVFIFNFIDISSAMIFTEDEPTSTAMRNFSKLLCRIYGQNCVCFKMVKHRIDRENPFVNQSDLLIKF